MQHLSAYYESQDGGAAYHNVTAILDQIIFTSGDDIRVPEAIANVLGIAVLSGATTLTASRISSPTLRQVANPNIEPMVNALVFGSYPEFNHFPLNPIKISGNESVRCEINSDHASAVGEYGLILLGDGQQAAVNGDMFSVRFTAGITLAEGTWVNGALTFESTLPDGRYQVVGQRYVGTNLVAGRLVFPGQAFRPGAPAVNAAGDLDVPTFRFGRGGVFGEFDTNQPPTMDALGVTDTTQSGILDLIKVG